MDKCTFSRIRRNNTVFYIATILFFALCAIGVMRFYFVFIDVNNMRPEDYLMLSSAVVMYLIWLIYFQVKVGGRRRRVYDKFEQLSDVDKTEINTELESNKSSTTWIHFGNSRIYLPGSYVLEFVDYKDIIWVYPCNILMPSIMTADGVTEMFSDINFTYLMIYDCDGKRRKIAVAPGSMRDCIETIEENAPNAVIGYTKARKKLAKKDFDRFMLEERQDRDYSAGL